MNRIGIKIDLDTGDLVSSAGRARQSIAGLTDEMKKAQKEGRWDDYTKIAVEKERLQGKTSGFERDIRTLANDPNFQTQGPNGSTVLKIDSEYASSIKSQTEAIKRLTDEYEKATKSGDVTKIQELTPRIEQQQTDFHKTIEEVTQTSLEPKTGETLKVGDLISGVSSGERALDELISRMKEAENAGDRDTYNHLSVEKDRLETSTKGFEKDVQKIQGDPRFQTRTSNEETVSKKVEFDVGDAVSNAGKLQKVLSDLSSEMRKAQKKEDWEKYKDLALSHSRLQGSTRRFEQDIQKVDNDPKFQTKDANGNTVFKMDSEYGSLMKSQIDTMKKLIAAQEEAVRSGDMDKVHELSPQIQKAQSGFHKTVEEATKQTPENKHGLSTYLNVQTAQQIIGALETGIKTYVSHLDRSSIVNRQGGGDVVGAEMEELRRTAAEKNNLWGTVGKIGGGILGTAAGIALALVTGGSSLMLGAAGAAIGSSLFGAAGGLAGTVTDEAEANRLATREAYSQQWERQAPAAMELAAMQGKYGGNPQEDTRALRESFALAAKVANEFGYSAEDGMDAIKQGAMQGLSETEATATARSAFAFERGTGADRNTLLEYGTRAARFGDNNALSTAWQGNQASGMAAGQFNEFLRAMRTTFEDGISKGFVRGSKEIAGNLTYLSELSGGNELYKGERGAQVLQNISSGFEKASGLGSVDDILTYQAADKVIADMDTDELNAMLAKSGIKAEGLSSWEKKAVYLGQGFDPTLFNQTMKNFNTADFGNNDDVVGRMMRQWGLNATQSVFLRQRWEENGQSITKKDYQDALKMYESAAPKNDSADLSYLKEIEGLKTHMSKVGQVFFDNKYESLPGYVESILAKINKDTEKVLPPTPTPASDNYPPTVEDAKKDYETANAAYIKALQDKDSEAANQASIDMEISRAHLYSPQGAIETDRSYDNIKERSAVKSITGEMFDEWFGSKDDKTAYKKINTVFDAALSSGNSSDQDAALQFSELIASMDKGTLDKYNKNDAWNQLGNASDIQGLLSVLGQILEATKENGKITYIEESSN